MKKYVLVILLLLPFLTFADSEVHITQGGITSVTSAKVAQLAGKSFFARLYWGTSFIRILIKTTGDTKFFRGTGEATTLAEIHDGDTLDISGQLEYGSESLVLLASTVKNVSVQKAQRAFSGTVVSVDRGNNQFTLQTKSDGNITVVTNSSTVFSKGSRVLDIAHLASGDLVLKTSGEYDLPTKTLKAVSVTTYVDMKMYKPKNFEGKLVSVTGTVLKVLIGKTEYTVNLSEKAEILTKNRKTTTLARFVPGDTVRVYGAIREVDEPVIDGSVVRNVSL